MNCPNCSKLLENPDKCRYCGATRSVNSESGYDIWKIRGRVVAAPGDMEKAELLMQQQIQAKNKFLRNGKE